MFGPVVVLLQGKLRPRLDHDPLDPVPLAQIHRLIPAPGAVVADMLHRLIPARRLQRADQALDLLCAVARDDHDRVRRLDDGESLDTDGADQPPLGMDQVVLRLMREAVAADGIAGRVLLGFGPDRVPVADIGPAEIPRRDARLVGLFHEAVIEGDRPDLAEALARHEHAEILLHRGDRLADQFDRLGLDRAHRVDQPAGAEREHAGIPETALGDQLLRPRLVGFLDEPGHGGCPVLRLGPRLDVAVARRRSRRRDADHRDAGFPHRGRGGADRLLKGRKVADQVVRRHHRQNGIGVVAGGDHRRAEDRRHRVAPFGLDHHPRLRRHRLDLVADGEAHRMGADHHRLGEIRALHPAERHLQKRLVADDRQELLGHPLARYRPEPRAGTAAKDHREDRVGHVFPFAWCLGACPHLPQTGTVVR